MKKVLSTVAALGLIAGLASTAGAVEFKMSGKYLVEGAYISDAAGTGLDVTETAAAQNASDAYWLHTFEMKPTMKVNDKISMSGVIRLADDTFWGGQTGGDSEGLSGTNDVYVHQLFMDYASPIGNMRFGRVQTGTYGTSFMDPNTRGNRVMLWPSALASGPWSTLFYIQKGTENTVAGTANAETDADSDAYVARLYYKTDTTDAGIHYGYTNNMTTLTKSDRKNQLTAYGKYKMDNYFLNAELNYLFGEVDNDAAATLDTDYNSWAGMLEVGGKFDALTPSLMYFYAQGDDNSADDELNANLGTGGTGDMFEPLYILTRRHTGMLNDDIFSGHTATLSNSGIHAIVASVDYAVSKDLTLHGAIGWAKADEVPVASTLQDDDYGWEYNVGAAYKLLDNLTYEAHFGYLDTGDYFNGNSTTDTTNNIYILTHSLTMTF